MKRTILIVDDSKMERTILTGFLKDKYNIVEAESGEAAINILLKSFKIFSAIIMDVVMPGMGGIEAVEKIKSNMLWMQIPIIITTGLDDDETRENAVVHGADNYVTKPYNKTLLQHVVKNAIKLSETASFVNAMHRDKLTKLYNKETFLLEAHKLIKRKPSGYYVLSCFDIENFKVINDQYGNETGDNVLRHVGECLREFAEETTGLTGRYSGDKFAVLYPAEYKDSEIAKRNQEEVMYPSCLNRQIRIRVGRYTVNDSSLSVSAMFDRASMAERTVKGKYDSYIAEYTESMRDELLHEQRIVYYMESALKNGEFEPWFQPQYNHATGTLIGSEALVRWKRDDKIIPPNDFIPIFEKNGFIYELDKYVWRQVCVCLRKWIDKGETPMPVSVNISRYDIFQEGFWDEIQGLVNEFDIPKNLLRLEITESAFAESTNRIIKIVKKLIKQGFTVEIDDFGSGFSSLNTLKDVPAHILKLDMRFFENTDNNERSGNVIQSVVRMANWLGMAVIAEGVEEKEQADYLKSIGCYYIQGYYYSKPIDLETYEKLVSEAPKEEQLTRLKTLDTLDKNEFWNPKSMETLIFNSYVGGACIFEYQDGRAELLRMNEQYTRELGEIVPEGAMLNDSTIVEYLDNKDKNKLIDIISTASKTHREASCEVKLTDGEKIEYIRMTVRIIARAGERLLCYGVVQNITAQKLADTKLESAAERISAVMDCTHCGISAVIAQEDGNVEYLFVNSRFYELLGYTKEQYEAEVKSPFDCVYSEDRDRVFEIVTGLIEIGDTVSLRMRDVCRDGSIIWLRCDISIVKFADVTHPVQMSSFLDITEQVENEMKRLESARKLEVIMSNVSGGVSAIQINDDGTSSFVFNNEKYYELYGYSDDQARAEHLDVMSLILPEDIDQVMSKIRKLKKDKQPTFIDYAIKKADGSKALLRANASLMSIPGYGDDVITSVITDITEKKSLEDQLRAIVDNIYGGVTATVIKDGKPEFVIINNRFVEMLGYATREEFELACGDDKYARIHPDDQERIVTQFESMDGGKTRYTMEYRIIRKDGMIRYIRNNISVINLFGIDEPVQLSVANDMTDMVEAQLKAQNLSRQLSVIMSNIHGGVTATLYKDMDNVEVVFSNDGFCEMYGYTKEQMASEVSNVLDLILPEDRERTMETVARIIKTRIGEAYEYRCYKRDGGVVWIQCNNSVISIDGVGDTVLLAVTTDITAIKEANNQLKFLNDSASGILAQSDSNQAILDTLNRLRSYCDAERAYVVELNYDRHVSNNTYEVCADGVSSEKNNLTELSFGNNDLWFKKLADNGMLFIKDVDRFDDNEVELRRMLMAQGIHSIILSALWSDKKLIGFVGVDNPSKSDKQIKQLKAMADYFSILLMRRDLMAKIENEHKKLQQLLDNLPTGIALYEYEENKLSVIHINQQYWKLVDREPIEYKDTSVMGSVYSEDRAMLTQEINSAIRQNRNISVYIRILCGQSEYKPFHITASILPQRYGKYLFYAAYMPVTNETMSLQEILPITLFTMMNTSEDISYVKDKDLRYICCSQAVADMVGYESTRDLIGKNAYELFDNLFAEKFTEDDRRVIETGESVIGNMEHVPMPDGKICLVKTSKYPIHDVEGNTIGVYCTSQDITLQRQKETELELLTDTIPGGIASYLITKNGFETLYFNDGYYQYSGYTRDEYVSMTEEEPLALMLEEDRPKMLEFIREFALKKEDGMTGSCSYRCNTKNGGLRWMNMKASLRQMGEDSFVLNVVQLDITERMETAEKDKDLLDNLPFGAALYAFDGKNITAIHINKQYSQMVNRNVDSSLEGFQPIDFIHPDDHKVVFDELTDAIANNRDAYCNIRLLYGENEYRTFHLDARIALGEKGKYLLYVAYSYISEEDATFTNALPFIFTTIMESSTDLAFAKDINFRYICCSKTFATLLGLRSEKDVIGKTDYELFPTEIANMFRRDDSKLFATGEPQIDIEESIPTSDGAFHYTRTSKHLLRNTAGTIIGVYCIGRDITKIKEAYAQLRLLTESIPGGIATFRKINNNISLEYYNEGLCNLSGYSRNEFDKLNIPPLEFVFDEDMPDLSTQIEELSEKETPVNYSMRIHTKDGGYKWISCKAVVADHQDNSLIVNAVLMDITQQQEEKERLRVSEELNNIAIKHSGNIITKFDVEGRILTLPESLPRIFDLPHILKNMPEEQISLGRVSPDTADMYRKLFNEIISGEKSGTVIYKQNSTKGWRWLEAQFTTVFSNIGEPVSAVISFADITRQVEKEIIYDKWQQSLDNRPEDSFTLFRCNLSKGLSFESREGGLLQVDFDMKKKTFDDRTDEYVEQCVHKEDRDIYLAFLNTDTMLAEYHRGHRSDILEYREVVGGNNVRWIRLTVDLVEYPNSKDIEAYLMFEDIDKQKKIELEIIKRAERDSLTGVYNRATFISRLENVLKSVKPGDRHALLMLDVDNFKSINDTLGHSSGDQILKDLTSKLESILRHTDMVGRLGGDEFFVFLKNISNEGAVIAKAKQICGLNIIEKKSQSKVTVSIGIAMIPENGKDFDTLYKKVDKVLYKQKEQGKNGYKLVTEQKRRLQNKEKEI